MNEERTAKRKIVIFGLDGATWRVLDPLISKGHLPNLQKLISSGARGTLQSTKPAVTAAAWPAMLTGRGPERTGVTHFLRPEPSGYDIEPSFTDLGSLQPIWQIVNYWGDDAFVFNVPTIGAEDIAGQMVTGPLTKTEHPLATPSELESQLTETYSVYADLSTANTDLEKIQEIRSVTQNKLETSLNLAKKEDWNLLVTCFYYIDQVQHRFWHYLDSDHPNHKADPEMRQAIENYFSMVDSYLGEFIELLESDSDPYSIFVVSDHGHGQTYESVDIDLWLSEQGHLKFDNSESDLQSSSHTFSLTKDNIIDILDSAGLLELVLTSVPERVKEFVGSRLPDNKRTEEDFLWDETTAWSYNTPVVYINSEESRESGTVSSEEYDDRIEDIRSSLLELEDPERNVSVVKEVLTAEEAYGEFGDIPDDVRRELPDLIVIFRNESEYKPKTNEISTTGEPIFPPEESSTHIREGIIVAHGDGIPSQSPVDMNIRDVYPSALRLMGYPIPERATGNAPDIFADTVEGMSKMDYNSGASGRAHEQNEEIYDRLRDMGYL